MKASKTLVLLSLVWSIISTFNSVGAKDSTVDEVDSSKEDAQQTNDVLTVDEESVSPEGACYANSSIYQKLGNEYKSTVRSIPATTIEQIRKIVLKSKSRIEPNLEDFGITRQSVLANQDVMVRSVYESPPVRASKQNISFATLPEKLKPIFEYDTVSKNALAEITGAMNSVYDCVRIALPGTPKIILFSRRHHGTMLPWTVRCGESKWLTYDRSLPPALAGVTSEGRTKSLTSDRPHMKFEDYRPINKTSVDFWPDGFFKRYCVWAKDTVATYDSIVAAQKIDGWAEASKTVKIDDALLLWDDSILVEVSIAKPGCIVTRARWYVAPNKKQSKKPAPNWNQFLTWYDSVEQAAQKIKWLNKWLKAKNGRVLMGMNTEDLSNSKWSRERLDQIWTEQGLSGKPQFGLRMIQPDEYYRMLYLGEPFTFSLVSDRGLGSSRLFTLPKAMRPLVRQSDLHDYNKTESDFEKCVYAVIDQKGAVTKASETPGEYAMPAGYPAQSADDKPYDYSWPVDFAAEEDIEYLHQKFDEQEIESVSPMRDETVRYGLVDRSGKLVLETKWKSIGPLSSGLMSVKNESDKWGFKKPNGETLLEPNLDHVGNFYEGLAAINKGDRWGFIDTTGKVVIPLTFISVRRFSDGLAPAKLDTKFGYINKTGKFVIAPQYNRARHFQNGLALVQVDGKMAYIDRSGKPIGGKYFDYLARFADERALFVLHGKYGYIDKDGHEIIPAKFSRAEDFRDGIATVMDGNIKKAIDRAGNFVKVPVSHSDFWDGPIKDGLRRARQDSKTDWKYGFTDVFGKFVIKPQYDEVGIFEDGLCPVKIKNGWGVIDKSGDLIISSRFEELSSHFSENHIAFRAGKKWGLLDVKGNVVLKPQFSKIMPFCNGLAIVQDGMKYGYINLEGKVVIRPQFDAAHQFNNDGLALISTSTKASAREEFP